MSLPPSSADVEQAQASDGEGARSKKRERPADAMDDAVIKRNQALYNKHANVDGRDRQQVRG